LNHPYVYRDETITLLHSSDDFDVFTLDLARKFVSQPHMDTRYDQYFVVLAGNYNFVHGQNGIVSPYGPGQTIFIPKNTPFQIYNTSNEAGRMIGIFLPGHRFDLVKEISNANLTLEQIEKIEAKYGVYSAKIPNTLNFQ
jgi:mannose-6-phosphate isomerase-like protein (cupin superfamily)